MGKVAPDRVRIGEPQVGNVGDAKVFR